MHGKEKPQEAAVLIVPTRELENLPRGGLGKREKRKRAMKLPKPIAAVKPHGMVDNQGSWWKQKPMNWLRHAAVGRH